MKIWFVTLFLSDTVHQQALGFTDVTFKYSEAEDEDKAAKAASEWLENESTKQGFNVKVVRTTASVAAQQDKNRYVFPEQILVAK